MVSTDVDEFEMTCSHNAYPPSIFFVEVSQLLSIFLLSLLYDFAFIIIRKPLGTDQISRSLFLLFFLN